MIQMADIREWRTHDVVDTRGHRIGELEAIYDYQLPYEPGANGERQLARR